MNRLFTAGVLTAGLTLFGCSGHSGPEGLELTVEQATYAFDPAEAGPKGGGDLGQSYEILEVGSKIVAECVVQRGDNHLADAVRIRSGEFAGKLVPLRVFVVEGGSGTSDPEDVFNASPDKIRDILDPCLIID